MGKIIELDVERHVRTEGFQARLRRRQAVEYAFQLSDDEQPDHVVRAALLAAAALCDEPDPGAESRH